MLFPMLFPMLARGFPSRTDGQAGGRHCRLQPAAVLVIGALLLLGCGDSDAEARKPAPKPTVQRLAVSPPAEWEADTVRTVRQILIPPADELDGRVVSADSWQVEALDLPEAREARVLRVQAEDTIRVRLPDSGFDPTEVSEAVLKVVVRGQAKFQLALHRDGEIMYLTEPVAASGINVVHELEFGFERLRSPAPIDQVVVRIPGRWFRDQRVAPGKGLGIISLELRHRPASLRLPDPSVGPDLVRVGTESRRAVGLVPERPLETVIEAQVGRWLELMWAQPNWVFAESQLRLSLAHEDGTVFHDAIFDGEAPQAGLPEAGAREGWRFARLDLSPWAGRMLTARFIVEPGGDGSSSTRGHALALVEPQLVQRKTSPRTVMLITSDTHRADHIGMARDGVGVQTPFLDDLAARGLLFEDCTSPSNLTNPAHISLLTGLSSRNSGVFDNVTPVSQTATTMAEIFRDAGFATWAAVSTRHLANDLSGLGQGFDRMSAPVQPDREAAQTIALLDSWWPEAKERDLFVWLHVFDVHAPYVSHPEFDGLYYPADKDPYDPTLPEIPKDRIYHALGGLRDREYPVALYKSEVSHLDQVLGRSLSQLPRDDVVLAFTSDHGEALLEHRAWFTHGELYPATLRVPLILLAPGVEPGRSPQPVTSLDLGRTLLDLGGLDDVPFPGRSLIEQSGLQARAARNQPRFALAPRGEVASVFMDQWYLALHLVEHLPANIPPAIPRHHVELYDLNADPNCQTSVASDHKDVARRLRALLLGWLEQASPLAEAAPRAELDAATLAGLVALGYTDGAESVSGLSPVDPDCRCESCLALR